jgi:enterochelin esterase-like enzyme/N-acetylneuraminic acid mutarotase
MKQRSFRIGSVNGILLLVCLWVIILLSSIQSSCLPDQNQKQSANALSQERTGQAEGQKINLTFYSQSLKMNRKVQVYLPEGYNPESPVRYPVIYFIHGTTQNSYAEDPLFSIFNGLISNGEISPVILVKPDCYCEPYGGSYCTNSELNGNFEDYMVFDLIAFIDSAYQTIPTRDKRATMGWSMGGYSAMKLALKHPDIYCGVAAHSGMLNLWMGFQYFPAILSEHGGAPVSEYRPDAGSLTYGTFRMAGAFSPNLDHPPYFVDFFLDSMGNLIDSVWERWSRHSCPTLARNITTKDDLAIYFDCGTYDETMTYPFNTSFADSLDKQGLPYTFQSYAGSHYDRFKRYPVGLTFLDSVMNRSGSPVQQGEWKFGTPMPTARCFTGAAVLGGKIYVVGGAAGPMNISSVFEVYDPATDSWAKKANLPIALVYPNVCALQGKIYVFGGNTAIFSGPCKNCFVYDPESDVWEQISDAPQAYGGPTLVVSGGKVYLIGGGIDGKMVSDVNMYDPLTDEWTKKADMPTPRSMHDACVFENMIYVFGGTTMDWTNVFYPVVERYDTEKDSWSGSTDMPLGRWSPASCVYNGHIYLTGGHSGTNACNRVDILDPVTGTWSSGPPLQQLRRGHVACVVDGKIYVIGGCYTNNGTPTMLSSMEVFGSSPQ